MKKILFLATALLWGFCATAQVSLSQLWYYEATATPTELLRTNSATYSLAYNKITGKLYVANRGDKIYIIDPDSYSGTISSIPFAGLSSLAGSYSETYRFSKVRVDDNGVIYATAMQTNGIIYVYRWASENDNSPVKYTFTSGDDPSITGRVGDSMGLWGTGDNTYLYISGNGITNIYIFKLNAGVVEYYGTVDITAAKYSETFKDVAKGSISPEAADVLWLGSTDTGVTFRRLKINLTNKTYVSHEVISSTYANFNCTVGEFVNDNGKGFFFVHSGKSASLQNLNRLSATGNVGDNTVTMSTKASYDFSKSAYTTNYGYADIAPRKNMDGTTTFYVVTSQNYMAALKTNVVLPVQISSFSAGLSQGQSTLKWQSTSEQHNKGYQVLRSTDGVNFSSIAFVPSKAVNGQSANVLNYSYVDAEAQSGVNYYRLVQIDLDGTEHPFDQTRSVNLSINVQLLSLAPNPTKTKLRVSLGQSNFEGIEYAIFDGSGKKQLQLAAHATTQEISVAHLANGVYFLRVSKNGELLKTLKFIKQ